MDSSQYPWNVEVEIEGFTFDGPGFETRGAAEAVADVLNANEGVDSAEVVEQ